VTAKGKATGITGSPAARKQTIAPPGPPRESQSSIRTTHPTPTIEPNPKVKYSMTESVRVRCPDSDFIDGIL
jgi:hypothetical protein